jgi:hypothetical protein
MNRSAPSVHRHRRATGAAAWHRLGCLGKQNRVPAGVTATPLGRPQSKVSARAQLEEEAMIVTPQYTVPEVIGTINANMTYLQVFGTLANVLAYVQIIYGLRVGFRDRSHAIPLIAIAMFFARDSYYVLNYDYWIHTIDHPFFKANLIAMAIFACLELVVIWQIITYSRKEVGLGESWLQAFLSYVAIQAGVYIMFLWFRSMMGDPLYLECFAVSIVFSNLFNIPMLMRRGSRKGQSLVIAWAVAIQTGPVGFFMVHPFLGPYFMQPTWIAAGIANTVLAFAYLWMLYRAPRYSRDVVERVVASQTPIGLAHGVVASSQR